MTYPYEATYYLLRLIYNLGIRQADVELTPLVRRMIYLKSHGRFNSRHIT